MTAPILYDDTEIAKMLGLSLAFVRRDRRTAQRIPFVRFGTRVKYDIDRVREAIRALEVGGRHGVNQ